MEFVFLKPATSNAGFSLHSQSDLLDPQMSVVVVAELRAMAMVHSSSCAFRVCKILVGRRLSDGLRRFIVRRGRAVRIYSDQGTNFVGCANLFQKIDWNTFFVRRLLMDKVTRLNYFSKLLHQFTCVNCKLIWSLKSDIKHNKRVYLALNHSFH